MFNLIKNRNFWIVFWGDAFLILFSYYFAHYIRFDGNIPVSEIINFQITVIWILPLKLICFYFLNLYKGMWRYTSIHDLINLTKACLISSVTIAMFLGITVRFQGFSRGVYFIDFMLTFLLVGGFRISIRLFLSRKDSQLGIPFQHKRDANIKRLLIVGAGDAAEMLLREVIENPKLNYDVVGFIDDNPSKTGQTIHGVPVLGVLNDMDQIVKRNSANETIIAVPSASFIEMRRIVNFCESTGVPYKTIPGMGELIEGRLSVSAIREVRYEDLLGREPVELEMAEIGRYLTGKRVMVTGGAGSIGSELSRQIAPFNPERLIIVDRGESGLYEEEMTFLARYPQLEIVPVLGPVQNNELMDRVFRENEPDVVFHAAAYTCPHDGNSSLGGCIQ